MARLSSCPQVLNIDDSHSHGQSINPAIDFDEKRLILRHNVHYRMIQQTMVSESFSTDSPRSSSPPLDQLTPIPLCDMKVGEIQYGKFLAGYLCVDAFIVSSIVTYLEDINGMVVRLICIWPITYSLSNIPYYFPKDSQLVIKEPYLSRSLDGIVSIYIHNPGQLQSFRLPFSAHNKHHNQQRKEGNRRFSEKDWAGAIDSYTCCIEFVYCSSCILSSTQEVLSEMAHSEYLAYSNRAETWLKLNNFEEALRDSVRALELHPNYVKSLYRKGRALHGLQQYKQACFAFQEALMKDPHSSEIQLALEESRRCSASGILNVKCIKDFLIARLLNSYAVPPDCSDYIGSVEVRVTEDGRGRGLFASRDVKAGELLLVSNPLALIHRHQRPVNSTTNPAAQSMDSACEDLITAVTALARSSSKALHKICFLQADPDCSSSTLPPMQLFENAMEGDDCPPDDSGITEDLHIPFIRAAVYTNWFTGYSISNKLSRLEARAIPWYAGIWLLPSFINHSCLRNAKRTHIGDAMLIHAASDIEEGEEITISYFDSLLPLYLREQKFEDLGFICNCKRCLVERSVSNSLQEISHLFADLHENARMAATAAVRAGKLFPTKLPACVVLAVLALRLEKEMKTLSNLTPLEKNWIRASFANAYIACLVASGFNCPLSVKDIEEVITSVAPGHQSAFSIITSLYTSEKDHVMKACIRTYGKWNPDVLRSFILLHAAGLPFTNSIINLEQLL